MKKLTGLILLMLVLILAACGGRTAAVHQATKAETAKRIRSALPI